MRQVQQQAKSRYAHAQVDGLLWFWPQGVKPTAARHQFDDRPRFPSPFDRGHAGTLARLSPVARHAGAARTVLIE